MVKYSLMLSGAGIYIRERQTDRQKDRDRETWLFLKCTFSY